MNSHSDYELNVHELHKKLINICSELNIKKWDLGASSSRDISVQVQKGEPKQLKGSQSHSITVRVWNCNNQVGITSTSNFSDEGLKKALRIALDASDYGNSDETPDFSPLAKSELSNINIDLRNQVGVNQLVDKLKTAESILLNKHTSINSIPYNGLAESYVERLYLNSDGAKRHMGRTNASIYLYAKAEEEGRKPRSSGAVKVADGIDKLDIDSCIDETSSLTISHLNYKPIKTGKYIICFMPDAFLQLIGAFSSMFNARSIIDGVSLLNKESLGTYIAVQDLSLSDESLHPSNIGAFNFDGEGTPTQNIDIIKSGKLVNLIHSEATARKFGVSPTGHAGLGAKVSVSPDWLVIKNSNSSINQNNEFVHGQYQKEYILVEGLSALHSGIKASQGSFSLPFDGWQIKNGIKTSIEAATIAGDILNVLKNIISIESNPIVTHQGICPHIWVKDIAITGEE